MFTCQLFYPILLLIFLDAELICVGKKGPVHLQYFLMREGALQKYACYE